MCYSNTPKKIKWVQKGILGDKTNTSTWRESGDWVALHNIISRGSTHISDENAKPVLLQSQLILKPDNKNLKEGVD